MYDSTNVTSLPTDGDLYAGYVGGNWPTYNAMVLRFPNKVHVSIAVNASENAQVLDVETGDATPAQAPAWIQRQRAAGRDPSVYCNTSTWGDVKTACQAAGVPLPHWWEAHWDKIPTLSSGSVAKQYDHDIPPGYDVSVVADYWPGVDVAKGVKPMFDPPQVLRPVVASCKWPNGGVLLLGDDGSVYTYEGAPYLGGANGKPYFVGRKAARIEYRPPNQPGAPSGGAEGYRIIDTAGEVYNYPGP